MKKPNLLLMAVVVSWLALPTLADAGIARLSPVSKGVELALAQQQAQLRQQLATAQQRTTHAPWSGTEKQQRTRLREIKRSLRAETDYLAFLLGQLQEPASLKALLRELHTRGQAEL